jgi:uncharacterized membrane protein (UPF0182 family)
MNPYPTHSPSWLARIGFTLILTLALVAAVALSAVFFALFVVLGLIGGVWLWWQRRRFYKQMRAGQGDIIEAEYEILEDRHSRNASDTSKRPD